MALHYENKIYEIKKRLEHFPYQEFYKLYNTYSDNEDVVVCLATIQSILVEQFGAMNQRLPTNEYEAHFWAENSRSLKLAIDCALEIKHLFINCNINISIDSYYDSLFEKCRKFLSNSGGSTIPAHMEKVEVYYKTPIFLKSDTISIDSSSTESQRYQLTLIGEGSYAKVFKFKDSNYNKTFALKRANKTLSSKELERFKNEYKTLSSLKSVFVVEVYKYFDNRNEYIMEYLDYSAKEFYEKFPSKLDFGHRMRFVYQFLRGISYIHSKGLLHRDLSPHNVMIKIYDDSELIKICDFGLVKRPDSKLTSMYTEIKGHFNDPALSQDGFDNYSFEHEIYSITLMCIFFLTGKTTNFSNISNEAIKNIYFKGTNPEKGKRYKTLDELMKDLKELKSF